MKADPIEQAACAILFHTPPKHYGLATWIMRVVGDPSYTDDLEREVADQITGAAPYPSDEIVFSQPGGEEAAHLEDRALYQLARSVIHHRLGRPGRESPGSWDALSQVTLNTALHPDLQPVGLARDIAVCVGDLLNAQAVQRSYARRSR